MARALSKESLLANKGFAEACKRLYSAPIESVAERYSALTEGLTGKIRFFSASGRAEFIGNHTDHNHGKVIAAAIDMDVVAAVVPADAVTVESTGYPAFTVELDDEKVDTAEFGTSKAIVKGVLKGFRNNGRKIGGFTAKMHSTVCKGAGVSSSASFELVICEILNVLYNGGKMDFKEKARISQFAENVYFGKPSGLMDQLSASHGGVSYMDFRKPEAPVAESVDWPFEDVGTVIINCGGDHCDLTDEYAAIKEDMQAVARRFGVEYLRSIDYDDFFEELPSLKKEVSGRALLRAMHFFEENERVDEAFEALKSGDEETFLDLIYESGDSSYMLLQNCYPKGDVEQPIPLALAVIDRHPDALACRVHGGGFAGTVLAFVKKVDMPYFIEDMEDYFGKNNVFGVSVRNVGATEVPAED